jgi:hypothetical protein
MGLRQPAARLRAGVGLAAARRAGAVAAASVAVPAAVDLTPYAISPGNQGAVGSCVAWATGYSLLGWYANYQHHAGSPFAPMYVYTQINGGRDAGAYIPDAWTVLQSQGVAQQSVYTQGNYDWRTPPTQPEITNAALHKTRSHVYLFSGENQGSAAQTALQAAIAGNAPVVIGIPVHDGFFGLSPTNQVWRLSNTVGKSLLGYHAIIAVGYDSTGLRIENSWGTGWGAAGYATLAWDFVNRYVFEASVGTGFVSSTAAPRVTALSKTVLSAAGGETLTITGTDLSTVDPNATGAARLVNAADPSVTAALTVTGQTATTLTVSTTAVPTGTNGQPVQGTYRVVLTGTGGTSSTDNAAAAVTVIAPYQVTAESGATALTTGGTRVTLTGTGFGTTSAAFTANKVTATVDAKAAVLAWVDDNHVVITMPPGAAGSQPPIVLSRNGTPGPAYTGVRYVYPVPVVSRVAPAAVSSAGGSTVTVTLTQAASVDAGNAAAVVLVNAADPTVRVAATVTAVTATAVTVQVPAAPAAGPYWVVVTGSGGSSAMSGAGAQLKYVSPPAYSVAAESLVSAAGGTALAITGSDFGATQAQFTAGHLTAAVDGRAAPLSWVGSTRLTVAVPAGVPGAAVTLVLLRDGVAGVPDTNARYAAVISGSSQPAGPSGGGWLSTLTGAGFARSTGWALVDSTGAVAADLPVVANRDALNGVSGGVVLVSGGQAVVKLPPSPAGAPAVYRLTFTPDPDAFGSAVTALTSKSVLVYTDVG